MFYYCSSAVDGGQRLPKRRKIPKSSAIQGNTQALMEVLLDENQQVVKRSRAARPVLYAFPHYDKCDSLLYFANAVSRHTNSGDFCSLAKLFLTHIDQHCDITLDVVPCKKPNARVLLEIFRSTRPMERTCIPRHPTTRHTFKLAWRTWSRFSQIDAKRL